MGRKSDPARTAPSRAVLWLQQVAVLGDHLRPPHVAATGIRELMDVHRQGDIRIAMVEQECNLINALARQESSACGRMAEAMHGGKSSALDANGTALFVARMKLREGRIAVLIARVVLRASQGTDHVALSKWPSRPRAEHEVGRLCIGSQRRGARARVRFLIPLSSPCVRFSRTRLSDDLLGMAYAAPG
jgi:hypothetical protein